MTEIELKLALAPHPVGSLARRVAALPALAGLTGRRETLHNTYYDTPDHALLRLGVVLRVREVRHGGKTRWLQTFKMSDRHASALSRRGEWESALAGPELSAALLQDTPWHTIDPRGRLFAQLQACFSTRFIRRRWLCKPADGSAIEVALDIGTIVSGERSLPIQELELELKAGPARALLGLAQELAGGLPCIPATQSKSERGYALAGLTTAPTADGSDEAQNAPGLMVLARSALHSAFAQFTASLIAVCQADDPEPVHQARVGWRRFRSARRLFKPVLGTSTDLPLEGLQPLLEALTQLREQDVASTETLPALGPLFIAGDPDRALAWQALMEDLHGRSARTRARVRALLAEPATAQALLGVTAWLESLTGAQGTAAAQSTGEAQREWALRRVRRLGRELRRACHPLDDAQAQHRARILAKRLRYAVDSLHLLLPARRARRWHRRAQHWQSTLGEQRDLAQAVEQLARLPACRPIAEFLRGYQAGLARPTRRMPEP